MSNYFNKLNFREKLIELQKCRLIKQNEFKNGINFLKDKKIVIIGCGSQGLNQGLNMRESGLNISFALRDKSILNKKTSWINATKNKFEIGSYVSLIPEADLVINLTPDKQHNKVISEIQKLMKFNSILGYSHGFNIIEEGQKIRKDITVIMVAPKCPGTEVREEYKRGFGVPTLIAVHSENDPKSNGLNAAKSWAFSIGSHRAGVLESSFSAEVKSDLMGEQTILCGMMQTATLVCYEKLISQGYDSDYACKLIQKGCEIITESLKHGGITLMMDRLSNSAKINSFYMSNKIKILLGGLFKNHMDDIISGEFSKEMMKDWVNKDTKLKKLRLKTKSTSFENAPYYKGIIEEQEYFDKNILLISIIKAGIELSFETMINSGILPESAYYESLHELPLIANTIARKRLYEMNLVISDTAEYGNYIFTEKAFPILKKFVNQIDDKFFTKSKIENSKLNKINSLIRNHPIETIGIKLRSYMKNMKNIYFQ
ncbi:ketol-acid reductoisomerase [Buchnera aphidicola (Neophyllaphis varicolor)]|uniref:ketol-acid reductoisomerase n=1 Tax=Buchnera aphidicola TaxID=9 RepID=UPI0031B81470